MGTWAGIVRVSHMGARRAGAGNVHTDREQIEAIEGATPAGGTLEILPPELDVSGGLPLSERPSLRLAVEGVERGEYAGIIVAYQSRLFRNVEEEEGVWRRVEAAGGEVLLAMEGIDTSTVSGRMTRRIKAAINAAEREQHAELFEQRRRHATAAGIWQRRQTPTGYVRDPDTRRLLPDERAQDVRVAFEAAIAGEPMTRIAQGLGMTPSGARQLLRNRVYLGELRVGRHVNPDAHPAIIDPETFAAAGERLDSGVRPAQRGRGPALLAGLVRCAACGHVMTRATSRDRTVYRCPALHSGESCPAPSNIGAVRLERFVLPIALREMDRVWAAARSGDRLAEIRRELADQRADLDKLLDTFSSEVNADAVARAAAKRSARIAELEAAERSETWRAREVPEARSAREVFETVSAHGRNTLLRGFLGAVVVRRERPRVLVLADPPAKLMGGGRRAGVVPIPFDPDGPGVLRPLAGEDSL